MEHKSTKIASLTAIILLAGCASSGVRVGDPSARGPVTGSAAGANAEGASELLQRCDRPLGTLAVAEDTQSEWYQQLTSQYQLPSTVPLLRLLIQQSNCFVIVDRGAGLEMMQRERALQQGGELRGGSNMGGGQMVAADYIMRPSIQFAQQTGGGAAGAIVGMFSPVAGAIAGGMRKIEAATTLILIDGRSGVQIAISEGVASKRDFSWGAIAGGGGGAVGIGAWQNTPEGKIIAGAFMDSFNQMVSAARNYQAQSTGGALGTGGALQTDSTGYNPQSGGGQGGAAPVSMSVREAQQKLQALGLYRGTIDGIAGGGTADALRNFQRIRGLPVTGQLDAATASALR